MALWVYFDASALIKRYTQESGTPVVNEVFRLAPADLRMCLSLGLLEVVSILVRKRNDGRIQEDFFRKALTAFKAEVAQDESFSKLSVDDALILDSSALIEKYGLNATDAVLLRSVLERAGFSYHFGEDGSGLHSIYLRRGAGYYIDVGASQMVIDGRIRLKHGTIKGLDDKGVVLSDGSRLPADLLVCATGYGSMNGWAAKLISQEVADKVGKCWGLGSETKGDPGPWVGELRNMWKPTQQPNLWFHGGNLMQSRHYSLYLALQLKARLEGIPTPVYYLDPVHHLG